MSGKTILPLAVEMMEATNPYKKHIEEFRYSFKEANERNYVSLYDALKNELRGKKRSTSREGALERDYNICYKAISRAMVIYFEDYKPQSYAFLQASKIKFEKWLRDIADKYVITDPYIPEDLMINPNEQDTAIAMLKDLHNRKGRTAEDIANHMHISTRAIQKNLKKLDPDFRRENDSAEHVPFRIGGQPVETKIDIKPAEKGKAKRYRTLNTVHPLVLLENQMQVGTILTALAHSYFADESRVCYSIGLDIWYQLSDYSKERVRLYFASTDEDLEDIELG